MNPTISCPACDAEVTEARDFTGATLLLNPRPSPAGKLAVREAGDGTLLARLIVPAGPPREDEKRWNAHTCAGRGGGLAEVRSAQSRNAAAARNRRGRRAPGHAYGGAAGVQWTPPPGGAA